MWLSILETAVLTTMRWRAYHPCCPGHPLCGWPNMKMSFMSMALGSSWETCRRVNSHNLVIWNSEDTPTKMGIWSDDIFVAGNVRIWKETAFAHHQPRLGASRPDEPGQLLCLCRLDGWKIAARQLGLQHRRKLHQVRFSINYCAADEVSAFDVIRLFFQGLC